jgi:hypothetical protein
MPVQIPLEVDMLGSVFLDKIAARHGRVEVVGELQLGGRSAWYESRLFQRRPCRRYEGVELRLGARRDVRGDNLQTLGKERAAQPAPTTPVPTMAMRLMSLVIETILRGCGSDRRAEAADRLADGRGKRRAGRLGLAGMTVSWIGRLGCGRGGAEVVVDDLSASDRQVRQ